VNDLGNSTAASWVDYDNDGFLDLFVSNGAFWAQLNGGELLTNFLYRNNGNSNRWITLRLIGTASNRSAIGAKVRVRTTISGQIVWQVRQIMGGDSESNEQPLDAHFGLSDATNIALVRIEWPSGTVQELHDVAVNQFLTVIEPPRLSAPRITDGVFAFTLKADAASTTACSVRPTRWTGCRRVPHRHQPERHRRVQRAAGHKRLAATLSCRVTLIR